MLGDTTGVCVVVGGHEGDLHRFDSLPFIESASGEGANSGPSHASPVAADPPELELRDPAMRDEIPVLAEGLGLAAKDGLAHVLRGLTGKGGEPGADSLQVVAVGAADLRQVELRPVEPVDLGGAGSSRDRGVEGLDRVEVDLGGCVLHDAIEGAKADAA